MRRQTLQSNPGSDSPYFLLPPLTTSFLAANFIPACSIHDVTQKQIRERTTSCLEYLHHIMTCFDSYACYLSDPSSQLDKPEFSKCIWSIPLSGGFPGVYWKTRTIPGLSRSVMNKQYHGSKLNHTHIHSSILTWASCGAVLSGLPAPRFG